jgi:hypothetical protein
MRRGHRGVEEQYIMDAYYHISNVGVRSTRIAIAGCG